MLVVASWLDWVAGGQVASWVWWALALVILVALLLLGLKMLRLFPE